MIRIRCSVVSEEDFLDIVLVLSVELVRSCDVFIVGSWVYERKGVEFLFCDRVVVDKV